MGDTGRHTPFVSEPFYTPNTGPDGRSRSGVNESTRVAKSKNLIRDPFKDTFVDEGNGTERLPSLHPTPYVVHSPKTYLLQRPTEVRSTCRNMSIFGNDDIIPR